MLDFKNDRIILYGAGYCGAMFAELLQKAGIAPLCFFDQNPAKAGTRIGNIPVSVPYAGAKADVLIVCILKKGSLYREIAQRMRQLGYERIVHVYDLREEAWLFRGQNLVLIPDREQVAAERARFLRLRERLSDALSRQTLDQMLAFFLNSPDVEFPAGKLEEQYFAYDIYRKRPDEQAVDCGAFKGVVLRLFRENQAGRFGRYTAIEPDPAYLPYLEAAAAEAEPGKVRVLSCALSDRRETLRMRNYAQEDSVVKEDGEIEVEAFPLDDLVEEATFLKIDVEGYEKKVIDGAQKLIRRCHPVVAAAAYHREWDVCDLYEQLQVLCAEYRFYLRSYMNLQETVLYAIPPDRLVKKGDGEK